MARHVLKILLNGFLTCAGVFIYYAGLARLAILLNRRSIKVLMYHACEQTESAFIRGLSINTTPAQFDSHLDFLTKYYRIAPLADLTGTPPSEPTTAITFDDGFRSVYHNAWPRLKERGLPATCYIATDVIDNKTLLWLNELNWFIHNHHSRARALIARWFGVGTTKPRGMIVDAVVGLYDRALIEALLAQLRAEMNVDHHVLARRSQLYLDQDQITEMSHAGMVFGNHTRSHPPLVRLSIDSVRDEIRSATEALERLGLAGAGLSLAYPFGSHSDETRRVALELGTQTLMEVEGVNWPLDLTRIGRIKVGSHSSAVLFARMEIVEPVKSWLKRRLGGSRPAQSAGPVPSFSRDAQSSPAA